jgi:membrane fusion protein, multidrug efflux system
MPSISSLPAGVLMLAFLTTASCTPADGRASAVQEDETSVRVAAVSERWISRPVTATGVVAPREEITLSFKIGGIVARVLVEEGASVRRGQTLAMLDLREIDAHVSKARSVATKAQRDLDRASHLYADSVASLEQLQNARTAHEIANHDLQAALVNRQFAVIVAPADGRIQRRTSEAGELVVAGAPVLVLGSSGAGLVLRAGVADRDAVRLRIGDSATVRFDAYPGITFSGSVSRMPAATTAGSRTHEIEVAFSAGGHAIVAGMVGEVELAPGAGQDMRVVPVESLIDADGSSAWVFTITSDGERARRLPVRITGMQDGVVGVSDGLDGVDRVISTGAGSVRDGARVRIVP